ncbi:MAG: hypothetical protein Hyperionvirus15_46 [Hyperionvirus sp.]|uniref:Uncharacterized protein n=1 Tax=Hyperionvirus sp. TaxID=2487770 RepID=A0A3G5A9R6_9VIRU|nr:MAG: hypothetical protein Hyperionvirus15_46 [Hyperionvirus sp.]
MAKYSAVGMVDDLEPVPPSGPPPMVKRDVIFSVVFKLASSNAIFCGVFCSDAQAEVFIACKKKEGGTDFYWIKHCCLNSEFRF